MSAKFKAPRGTFDALPEQQPVRARIEATARKLLESAGYGRIGTPATRAAYLDELRDHLRASEGELSKDVRERIDANPLRAFDADHEGTQAVMANAPKLLDRL